MTMSRDLDIIGQHLRLTARLFLRFGAFLTAIWAASALASQVLLRLAVEVGMISRILGLIALAPVILLQLLVFVAMFGLLRRGLPRLRPQRRSPDPQAASGPTDTGDGAPEMGVFVTALLAVLIPFYGYYAGWGFLGDTLRSYSQIFYRAQMARVDFTTGEKIRTALDIDQTGWVIVAVVAVWFIRRMAKTMHNRTGAGFWPMLVVACEATWVLLGLYVIGGWKDAIAAWLAALPSPEELIDSVIPAASAAITDAATRPVDWAPPFQLRPMLNDLFWYALLPLVWFNLGAIVYGHDLNRVGSGTERLTGGVIRRWQALPRPVTDFIGFFWMGLVKRWHAVVNGVTLAASAGFSLTVSVIVLWRLVDWLGNWAWIGLARLIGPQDMLTWQVVSVPLNALFNAPGAPAGGLLVSPLQFCIIAAGLELAVRAQAASADPVSSAGAGPA